MHDFCYVSKKEAAPVKAELLDIIHEVQDIVRDDFTFQFTFVGTTPTRVHQRLSQNNLRKRQISCETTAELSK